MAASEVKTQEQQQEEERMNRIAIALAALVASATTAAAQQATVVYTNVVDGQRVDRIVRVVREIGPAAPLPPSITTTPVLPKNWRPPYGPTYVPPVSRPTTYTVPVVQHRPVQQPLFVNGLYVGPSPTGNWTSTSVGRPVVDVRIIRPFDSQHATRSSRRSR